MLGDQGHATSRRIYAIKVVNMLDRIAILHSSRSVIHLLLEVTLLRTEPAHKDDKWFFCCYRSADYCPEGSVLANW